MKSFEIFDFIYETCNGYSNEQKGQLLTVLAEYYLNGVTSFPNVDKEVLGVANTAIKFNTQQSNEKYVSKETLVDWNRQIIGWCKDNNLIKQIKVSDNIQFDNLVKCVSKHITSIPETNIRHTMEWIKNKYDEKYYL